MGSWGPGLVDGDGPQDAKWEIIECCGLDYRELNLGFEETLPGDLLRENEHRVLQGLQDRDLVYPYGHNGMNDFAFAWVFMAKAAGIKIEHPVARKIIEAAFRFELSEIQLQCWRDPEERRTIMLRELEEFLEG